MRLWPNKVDSLSIGTFSRANLSMVYDTVRGADDQRRTLYIRGLMLGSLPGTYLRLGGPRQQQSNASELMSSNDSSRQPSTTIDELRGF